MRQVTLRTNVCDLIREHPGLKRVFDENGFSLDMTCLDKIDNTVEDAAMICGFTPDEMLEELNRALKNAEEEWAAILAQESEVGSYAKPEAAAPQVTPSVKADGLILLQTGALTLGGKFIHIRYFAVHDERGKYLGTLEVSQDITAIRALEGERRLLDEGE